MHVRVVHASVAIMFLCVGVYPSLTQADPWGEAIGGAATGAIFGAIVGGGDGAATGAILGGAMGAASGSAREDERHQQQIQLQRQQERAAWERQYRMQEAELQRQRQQAWSQPQPSGSGADASLITEIQKSLIRLGLDPGGVDGRLGAQTVAAIKMYQRNRGLLETGQPSQELLRDMLQNGG